MRKMIYGFLIFFICNLGYTQTNNNAEKRLQTLTKEIRCVVCQNQSLADSNAPLANDLREKIYQMIQQNQSDQEIKNYLVARYGEFILLEPRFNKNTVFLWLFPFIVVGVLLLYLFRLAV